MALGSTQPLTEINTRNISWGEGGKGGRCVGLTTLPPSCADCFEIWEPQLPGTLRDCLGIDLPLYAIYKRGHLPHSIARAERDGIRAETRFRLSPKRTSPFKSVGASVQSTAGSRGVRICWIDHVRSWRESTGYPLHSPVSPSIPLPCVTVCHQVPNELYNLAGRGWRPVALTSVSQTVFREVVFGVPRDENA